MAIYVFLILFFWVISSFKIKNVKHIALLKISFVVLYVMATIRSIRIGNDTANYYRLFEAIANTNSYTRFLGRYEIGYLLLNRIVTLFTNNFYIFLMIVNIIIYYAYYLFIKYYSCNYGLSILIFFTFGIWGETVNVIRLELATAMFIYAYIVLEKYNKKSIAILLSALAIMFQRVSIAYLAMFFVPKKLSKRFWGIATIASIIVFLELDNIIKFVVSIIPYFNEYFSNSVYIYGEVKIASVLLFVLQLLVFLWSIYVYRFSNCKMDKTELGLIESQINMIFISLLVLFISIRFNLLDRCENIYGAFVLLLLPNTCKLVNNKRIVILCISLLCIAYFVVLNVFRPEWNHIVPYHTFLFDK